MMNQPPSTFFFPEKHPFIVKLTCLVNQEILLLSITRTELKRLMYANSFAIDLCFTQYYHVSTILKPKSTILYRMHPRDPAQI